MMESSGENEEVPSVATIQDVEPLTKPVDKAPCEEGEPAKIMCESDASYVTGTISPTNDDYVKITNIYLCSLCLSPILHILDVGTDTYLAYQYWVHDEHTYFILTIIFVIVSAMISTLFSIRMYARDPEQVSCVRWTFRCVLLTLHIAPVIRYVEAFQHALTLRRRATTPAEYKKHSKLLLKEDSNLALLRILECFLEAAPQQVLQISILLTPGRPDMPPLLQIYLYMSLVTSFLSTSWTFAMYHRSIRFVQRDKMKLKWVSSIVQFSWIFLVTTSRILSISEAASVYPQATFAICLAHWFTMTLWLSMLEETWFCFSPTDSDSKVNKSKEFLFCAVMGLVYIFSYVAVNDKPTRYRYTFYYCVCFLEMISSIVVWILESKYNEAWWFLALPVITFNMFGFSIVMMLVYYSCYHPSLSSNCFKKDGRSSPVTENGVKLNRLIEESYRVCSQNELDV